MCRHSQRRARCVQVLAEAGGASTLPAPVATGVLYRAAALGRAEHAEEARKFARDILYHIVRQVCDSDSGSLLFAGHTR